MKKIFSLIALALLIVSLSACSSQEPAQADWNVPVEGISWDSLTAEEVVDALELESYDIEEDGDYSHTLYVSEDIDTGFDFKFTSFEAVFTQDVEILEGIAGLSYFIAVCDADVETVKESITEVYGEPTTLYNFVYSYSYSWISETPQDLENYDELLAEYEKYYVAKGGDLEYFSTGQLGYTSTSLVYIHLAEDEDGNCIFVMDGSTKRFTEAFLKAIEEETEE